MKKTVHHRLKTSKRHFWNMFEYDEKIPFRASLGGNKPVFVDGFGLWFSVVSFLHVLLLLRLPGLTDIHDVIFSGLGIVGCFRYVLISRPQTAAINTKLALNFGRLPPSSFDIPFVRWINNSESEFTNTFCLIGQG